MTDFIISEEQLKDIRGMIFHEDEIKFEKLSWKITSSPLSEAIAEQRHGCLTCFDPTCPVWQAAEQNCWKSQADNDAQVAKKERERVLDKLECWRIQVNNRDGKHRVELGLMIESLRG